MTSCKRDTNIHPPIRESKGSRNGELATEQHLLSLRLGKGHMDKGILHSRKERRFQLYFRQERCEEEELRAESGRDILLDDQDAEASQAEAAL